MLGEVQNVIMRRKRISMIKLLNDLHLPLDASVKTTIGGLVLKILNSKAIWLGDLYVASWILSRCQKPCKKEEFSVSKRKNNSLEVTEAYSIHTNFASNA